MKTGKEIKGNRGRAERARAVTISSSNSGGLMALGAVLVVLLSYYAAKWAPPPKPKIIGIDLGTTFSCVGVYQAGTGEVQIMEDKAGRRTIPSVVGFIEDGPPIVGAAAKSQGTANPLHTIYEAKRFMGKNFSTITSQVLDRFPFKIMESEGDGRVAFRVTGEGAKLKMLSPEEIGGMVVGELKHTAEEQLGAKIKLAVMSVPAEFNEAQRNATIRAGELAGLEVLRVLSEPTAAAMAYGLHNKAQVEYIVVFDFGGGTLDVSLLRVDGGMYSTYAVAGNKHLGGEDLSHRLYLHGLTLFEAERGVKMRSAISMQRLRSAVERAKILLSKVDSTIMFVELDRADESSGSSSSSGDGATFKVPVTRKMFEAINADLFEKVMAPLHRVLDDAEVDKSEIDEVVLVGGSTRIPKVRELLTIFLGKPPCSSIDPDEAVAVGVSMQAGILGGAWPLQVSVLEAPWTGESVELE